MTAVARAVLTDADVGEERQASADARQTNDGGVMPAVAATVEQLLAKNSRLSKNDLRHMQEWLDKQPHLPHMLDEEIVPFLVSNQYSLERAKECVDKCMTMRTHAPELFSGRDPADAVNKAQFKTFRVARLPSLATRGRRLVVLGYAPRDTYEAQGVAFDGARSLALSTALMEIVALQEAAAADDASGGLVLLLDAAHATPAHVASTPLPSLQRLLAFVQEAAPLRVDAVHVLRLGPVGRRALAMLRPFMGAVLQRMMHVHSDDLQDLHKEFPPEILPEEFGGACGSIAEYHQELVSELEGRREWLLTQEKRVADESKRPGGPRVSAADGVFGAHGSFRSLDVD